MTKRKKQVTVSAVFLSVALIIILTVFLFSGGTTESYNPGESIEGITSDLDRSLPVDYPRVQFTDATSQAGIDFHHFSGQRTTQLPEDMGSGVAWGDYDNDGWDDLFLVNQVGPLSMTESKMKNSPAFSKLYHNEGDGTFKDVTSESGITHRDFGMGAAWGDYNNDGFPDLVLTNYGKNILYRNNGDGTFTDETAQSGLNSHQGFWTGASWGDYNRDGNLDLYVCGYVQYESLKTQSTALQYEAEVPASLNPSSFAPERNLLYRNNGDGTFIEIAAHAGVLDTGGRSLSAAWVDFDQDGWLDLYVANDVSDNVLYRNSGNGEFEEISHTAMVADYRGAMGIAVADWDLDADLDMFITHWIAQENALYNSMYSQLSNMKVSRSNSLRFMDVADKYGLGQIALDYIGFGTTFLDYNNDGFMDLFVTNGSTLQQSDNPSELVPMPDQLFWNHGSEEGFYDVSGVSGELFNNEYVGRGAAASDYDNDGDVDLFIVNNLGPGQLLRNDGETGNNWIKINLRSAVKNRFGIGAQVRLINDGQQQLQQVGSQSSYLSQNSSTLHFGLNHSTDIDSILVLWPDGFEQILTDKSVNQLLTVTRQE